MKKLFAVFLGLSIASSASGIEASESNQMIFGNTGLSDLILHENLSVYGEFSGRSLHLDGLSVHGKATLTNVILSEALSVQGALNGSYVQGTSLTAYGNVDLLEAKFLALTHIYGDLICQKCEFHDTISVFGKLTASHTLFKKDLSVSGEEVILEDITAQNITIESDIKTPTLILKGNSIILGNILFSKQPGHVRKDSLVQIRGKTLRALD